VKLNLFSKPLTDKSKSKLVTTPPATTNGERRYLGLLFRQVIINRWDKIRNSHLLINKHSEQAENRFEATGNSKVNNGK
jgi:hypothetical protein